MLVIVVCVCVQDFLGKSDPYLEFAKQNTDGTFTVTHRTQVTLIVYVSECFARVARLVCRIFGRWLSQVIAFLDKLQFVNDLSHTNHKPYM